MKNKYVAITGLAFNEKGDMDKLASLAKKGWILDGIVCGGFFYKLRKEKPRDLIYSVDYQCDCSLEYIGIFKEAGWELVVSAGECIHIFMADAGTKPIYSDNITETDKYESAKNQTKKGSIYTFIAGLLLLILPIVFKQMNETLSMVFLVLFVIDLVFFVFNFLPFLAYSSRIRKKDIQDKTKVERGILAKISGLNIILDIVIIILAVMMVIKTKVFTIPILMLFLLGIILLGSEIIKLVIHKRNMINQ